MHGWAIRLVHSGSPAPQRWIVSVITRMFERMGEGAGAGRYEVTVKEVEGLARWAEVDPWLLLGALARAAQQDVEVNLKCARQCRQLVDSEVALEVQVPSQRAASDAALAGQFA